ncbi:MAG TPA: lactonase family protein, partial [Opitutaceae bacterium]
LSVAASAFAAGGELFYIGTYNSPTSKGIYASFLNTETGELSAPVLAEDTVNAAALAVSADGRFLYACNEVDTFHGKPTGSVTACSVSGDGTRLRELDQESSEGKGPCALSISKKGDAIFVANYTGGSITALQVKPNGELLKAKSVIQHEGSSANPKRQDRPHAHEIISDPQGEFVYAVDLGLDRIKVYRYDEVKGLLVAVPERDIVVKPGTGPRHIAFNKAGDRVYVLGEMASNLTVYKLDRASGFTGVIETLSLLPDDFQGENTAAEIEMDSTGKYLYASNRGDDSIVVMEIESDGQVKYIQRMGSGGKTPRNFVIDPSGQFLLAANQDSNSIVVFKIDTETGELHPSIGKATVGKPVSLVFSPTHFLSQ